MHGDRLNRQNTGRGIRREEEEGRKPRNVRERLNPKIKDDSEGSSNGDGEETSSEYSTSDSDDSQSDNESV